MFLRIWKSSSPSENNINPGCNFTLHWSLIFTLNFLVAQHLFFSTVVGFYPFVPVPCMCMWRLDPQRGDIHVSTKFCKFFVSSLDGEEWSALLCSPLIHGKIVFCTRLSSWIPWPLKMGPISCPETSIMNYHYALWNIPEERRSHLLGGRSLKWRVVLVKLVICLHTLRG